MSLNTVKIEELISPLADSIGLKIAEVEYAKKNNGMNLTVFIYKDDGAVTLADCEKFHKLIDAPLDELNPTNDKPYTLNVSSLGIDRHLKTEKDFEKNTGKVLTVKLFKKTADGKKEIEGKLTAFDAKSITLEQDGGGTIVIMLQDAAKITQKIYI